MLSCCGFTPMPFHLCKLLIANLDSSWVELSKYTYIGCSSQAATKGIKKKVNFLIFKDRSAPQRVIMVGKKIYSLTHIGLNE